MLLAQKSQSVANQVKTVSTPLQKQRIPDHSSSTSTPETKTELTRTTTRMNLHCPPNEAMAPQTETSFCDTIYECVKKCDSIRFAQDSKTWSSQDGSQVSINWISVSDERGDPLIFSLRGETDTAPFKVPFGLDLDGMYNVDSTNKTTTVNISPSVASALDQLQTAAHSFIFKQRIGKKAKLATSEEDIKRHCPCAFYRLDQSGNHASIRARIPTLPANSAASTPIDETLLVIENASGDNKTIKAAQDTKFFADDVALEVLRINTPNERHGFNVVYRLRYLEYSGTTQQNSLPPMGDSTTSLLKATESITLGDVQTNIWTPRDGLAKNVNHSLPILDTRGQAMFIELKAPVIKFPITVDSNNALFALSDDDMTGATTMASRVRDILFNEFREKLSKSFVNEGTDHGPFWPNDNIENIDDMRFAGPDVVDSEWKSFRGVLPTRYDSISKKRIVDTSVLLVRDKEGRPFPIQNINRDTPISSIVIMPSQVTLPASASSRIRIKFLVRKITVGQQAPRRIAPKRRMASQLTPSPKRAMRR